MRNKKFFTRSGITLKGHPLGYITDGNASQSDQRSVRECNNIDFENYDKRRDPYSLYSDTSTVVPLDYTIDTFFVKDFIDKSNTVTRCQIIIAKKATERTRIFVNKYYNPGNSYSNGQNVTTGWISDWTELTESVSRVLTGAISTANGTCTITAPKNLSLDYYRGFFVYDGSNNCVGIITKSTVAASAASCTLTIRTNPYLNSGSISLRAITSGGTYTLSRFPVNVKGSFIDIKDVSIVETYNTVRISCGESKRILWIGLINDRNFFNQSSPIGSGDHAYYTAWYGWWMGFDSPDISNKKIYDRKYYTSTGSVISFLQTDIAELGGIITYQIQTTSGAQADVKIASLAVSMDGYQPVFLKNLMIDKDATGHNSNSSIWNYINMIWTLEFDRRLTELHLFYGKSPDFESINSTDENVINEIFQTSRMENNAGGSINFTDKPRNSGLYDVAKNAYLTSWINYDLINYGYDWSKVGSNNYNYANGGILDEYLGANYYSDIVVKCRMIIKLGNLLMAIGLKDKLNQIAITNIINGNVETESIYSAERTFKATSGEELVGGAATQQEQFLLFTKTECIVCELIDPVKNIVAVTDRVKKGCTNKKSIVSARLSAELQGVFWSGYDTKYFFVNNEITDLLENRWRDEYQALSNVIKEAIVAGYYKNRNEVFFCINSKLYVWCLYKNLWKIYTYPDVPLNFQPDLSGELLFSISNILYQTEKIGTAQYLDKGTDAITFRYLQILNHGSNSTPKILKGIELTNIEVVKNNPAVDSGIIVRAGKNNLGSSADIANEEILLTDSILITNKLNKKRSNYYFFELKNGSTGNNNIKTARFNEINLKSKVTRKKLQKTN